MCDVSEHHSYVSSLPDFSLTPPAIVASAGPITQTSNIDPLPSNIAGYYGDLWAENNLVAIGTQQGTGVAIVDISNKANPTFQSHYNPSDGGKFKDVVIRNGIGYFALDNNNTGEPKGIHIVNLANPQQPQLLGKIQGSMAFQHNHNVIVDGNFLYAAPNDQPRVRVYNISNPAAPTLVKDFATTNTSSTQNLHDFTLKNGKLYTSNTDNGWTDVYNVSNMSASWSEVTNKIASFNVGSRNHSNDVTNDGNFVVCCREISNGDCQIWSLMTPGTPVKVATINKATIGVDAFTPHDPEIVGDKLYISWYQAGVQVFDIANPANPQHLGGFDTSALVASSPGQYLSSYGGNWGLFPHMGPDQLLVSDMENGLFVLDATAAVATTRYWDINGTTAGAGGATPAGTWTSATTTFNTDPAGGPAGAFATPTTADTVVFAAGGDATGAYTVTLPVTAWAAQINFTEGHVTLAGGTISVGTIDVSAGVTATVMSATRAPASSIAKTGGGVLRMPTLPQGNSITISAGTLRVLESSPSPAGNDASVSRPSSLTIAPGATLDLTNNDLILDYSGASPIATYEALVASAYNVVGDWQGDGITSSVAALDGNYVVAIADNAALASPFGSAQGGPLFAGVNVDLTTILIKFTHRADINLDGLITPDDSAIFGGNYDENQPAIWAAGDLNYDGIFTPDDAAIFGGAYDASLTSLPEPGTATGVLGLLGALGRRRRLNHTDRHPAM